MGRRRHAASRLGCYLCLCLTPALLFLSGGIRPFDVNNADMLAVPAMVEAIRSNGWAVVTHWYWPPSPYLVPDFVVYVPVWLAVPNPWLAPAVVMVIQLAMLAWVTNALGRELNETEAGRWGAVGSFSLFVLLAEHLVNPYRFMLVSYYRAGTFLAGLIGLLLVLRMVRAGGPWRRPRALLALGLATAAVVCSDPLIVPSAIGPLAVLVVGLAFLPAARGGWSSQRRPALVLVGTLAVATVVGLMANNAIVSDQLPYTPSLSATEPFMQIYRLIGVAIDLGPVSRTLGLALACVLILSGLMAWRRGHRIEPPIVVAAFWVISTTGHVVAVAVESVEPVNRYLQLVFGLPLLVAGPLLAVPIVARARAWSAGHGSPRRRPAAAGAALARPMAMVVVLAPLAAAAAPLVQRSHHLALGASVTSAECLDRALPTDRPLTGVSGYWDARPIALASHHQRHLAVLDALGNPYRLNAAASWYDEPWSFAVVDTETPGFDLPPEWIHKLAPDATQSTCGPITVLVFKHPIDPAPLDQPGERVEWRGCELRSDLASLDSDRGVADVPAGGHSGYGTSGGTTPLPPGRFRINLTYRSPADAAQTVATMEIVLSNEVGVDGTVVQSVPLAGTDGKRRAAMATIDIPGDHRSYTVEVRTHYDGTHAYSVEGVSFVHRATPGGTLTDPA